MYDNRILGGIVGDIIGSTRETASLRKTSNSFRKEAVSLMIR